MRRKDYAYFFGYLKHGIILGLILVVGSNLLKLPVGLASRLIIPTCFVAVVTFFVLFLLDSRATLSDIVHSFVRAAAMVVYNYPVLLLGVFVFHVLNATLQVVFGSMVYWYTGPGALGFVLKLLSMISLYVYYSFFVCLCTNFYIKKVHDQFNLYFSVKEEV